MPNNIVSSAFVELFPKFNAKFQDETAKQIQGSMKAATKEVDKGAKKAVEVTEKHTGRLSRIIHNQFEGIAGPIAAVFAGAGLIGFFKSSIDAASDLNEEISKTGVIFGQQALPELVHFAEQADKRIGQSTHSALQAAGQFGVFGKSAGLTGESLSKFAQQMVTLTSDMASFSNTTPEEAVYAVGAALRGETEPIRRYGVLLDDATLRQTALQMGLIKTTKHALTPQQRVLAVQAQILKQTADAQGDFARTSGGLANQQRILRAQMANFKDTVGKALLPVMLKFTSIVNQRLFPALKGLGSLFIKGDFTKELREAFGVAEDSPFVDFLFKVRDVLGLLAVPLKFAWDTIKSLFSEMRSGTGLGGALVATFNELVTVLTAAATWLSKNQTLAKTLGIAIAALVVVTKAHTTALEAQQAVLRAGGLAKYIQQVGVVSTVTRVWAAVTWLATGALKAMQLAIKLVGLAFRVTPFGFVVTVIGLLVAGLIYAYKHSEKFRTIVNAVGNTLKGVFLSALHAVVTAFHAVVDAVKTAIDWVEKLGTKIVSGFVNAGKWLFDKGKDFIQGFIHGIAAALPAVVAWILRAPVVKVLAPWLFAAVWLVTRGREYIWGFLKGVAAVAKSIGGWLWRNVIRPTIGAFAAAGKWLFNAGKTVIGGLFKGIMALIKAYISIGAWIWRNIGRPLVDAYKAAATWLLNAGKAIMIGLFRGIVNYLRFLGGIAAWVWRTIGKPVVNAFGAALTWLYYKGREIIIGFLRGVVDMMRGVSGWIKKNVVDPIINAVKWFFGISSPSKVMAELGRHMVTGLFKGLSSGDKVKAIKKIFGSMPAALAALVSKGILTISQLPQKALDALGSAAAFVGQGFSVKDLDVFTYQGEKIQGSTFKKLQKAQKIIGGLFHIMQGSFSTRVSASAGTHSGGGVIDTDQDQTSWEKAVTALRYVGFAAWHRTPDMGPWGHHIHAVEIGNPTLSPQAKDQVAAFFKGGTGLAGYATGAWNILRDQLAYLHRGEMVAPVPVANTLRTVGARGGGAVNYYYFTFPNYVGDKNDLVKAIDDLKRRGRI